MGDLIIPEGWPRVWTGQRASNDTGHHADESGDNARGSDGILGVEAGEERGRAEPLRREILDGDARSDSVRPPRLEHLAHEAGVDGTALVGMLDSFCDQERDGAALYRGLARMTTSDEMRERYRRRGAKTATHIDIYQQMLRQLGASIRLEESAPRFSRVLERLIAQGSCDDRSIELAGLESVVAAELKCQENWGFLTVLVESLIDSPLRAILSLAVDRMGGQEADGAGWASSTWQAELLRRVKR